MRKCHACLLNLRDHCWKFPYPRGQWRGKTCPGMENEALYDEYRQWKKLPDVKTLRQIRRETFRGKPKRPHHAT